MFIVVKQTDAFICVTERDFDVYVYMIGLMYYSLCFIVPTI